MSSSLRGVTKSFRRLEEEQKHQIAKWLGEFIPPNQIGVLFYRTYGRRIDRSYPYQILKWEKWSKVIDRYRQQWLVNVAEVPEAHKKVRLKKIHELVVRLDGMETRVTASEFERRMLRLLGQARLEMEEKKSDQTNIFFGQFHSYAEASDEELLVRRAELLKRIQDFRWPSTRRIIDATLGNGRKEPAEAGNQPQETSGEQGQ